MSLIWVEGGRVMSLIGVEGGRVMSLICMCMWQEGAGEWTAQTALRTAPQGMPINMQGTWVRVKVTTKP